MNLEELRKFEEEFKEALERAENLETLEKVRIKFLGRKSKMVDFFAALKDIGDITEKKLLGRELNLLKERMLSAFQAKKDLLVHLEEEKIMEGSAVDITQPGKKIPRGHIHILSQVLEEIEDIFMSMGFAVVEGPEVETEYYNFDALNIPKNHPARDLWDTFWLEEKDDDQGLLLRTHTSPVQIRYMEAHNPPFRIIAPGRVFRYEATDASHDIQFYQVEGLVVDKTISLANFKAIIEVFFDKFFSKKVKVRLRPSYFPFTEPSVEVDIQLKDKKTNKFKWLEVMGAGMVHPKVFLSTKYNPQNWQGFAFGVGVDRLAMIKYNIPDIRLFYKGDLRFIKQF